jgi:hypothetical protein
MQSQSTTVLSCSSSSKPPSLNSNSSKSLPVDPLSTKSLSSDRTQGLDHNSDNYGLLNNLDSVEPCLTIRLPSAPLLRADTQHPQSVCASVSPPTSSRMGCASPKKLQKRQKPNHKSQVDEESGEQLVNTERRKGRASIVSRVTAIITILSISVLAITGGLLTKDPVVGLSSAATGFELVVCVVTLLHALD